VADFYTPPTGLALDVLAERAARRIVDMYSTVEAELLAQIARRLIRDLPENPDLTDQLAVTRALQDRARQLVGTIPSDLAYQVVTVAAEGGLAHAAAQLGVSQGLPRYSDITRTVAEAVAMTALDVGNAFSEVNRRILRYPIDAVGRFIGTDIYQATVARHLGPRLAGTLTTEETRRRTVAAFLEQGITGFVDRSNRRWTIGSYTEMAVRTGTQRAFTDAGVARMGRAETRFVTILGNNDACEYCGRWFNSILSIDGTPPGDHEVPHGTNLGEFVTVHVDATLEEARAAHFMHPNCACQLARYTPGLRRKQAATRYNPVAEKAREDQRALERRARELDRRIKVRDAAGVDASQAKARRRDVQARLRELTAESGQKRRYDREKATWAEGAPTRPSQPPIIPVVPGPPGGTLSPSPVRAPIGVEE
jgi:hypothetical protein